MSSSHLEELRSHLNIYGLAGYIVPSTDAHDSENPPEADERRRFMTNFTGSAGIAVILKNEAHLWVDGRYFLQADKEVDLNLWTVRKAGSLGCPTITEFLKSLALIDQSANAESPAAVLIGFDPFVTSANWIQEQRKAIAGNASVALIPIHSLTPKPATLNNEILENEEVSCQLNLVDLVWKSARPQYPVNPIEEFAVEFSGEEYIDKLRRVREAMTKKRVEGLLISGLDEIAWLYNLRGSDVYSTRVFMAYTLVLRDEAILFIMKPEKTLGTHMIAKFLNNKVIVRPYENIAIEIGTRIQASQKIWIPNSMNYAIFSMVNNRLIDGTGPVVEFKAVKNDVELRGFQEAHIEDGVALSAYLAYLDRIRPTELSKLNEYTASRILNRARKTQILPSFDTISGVNANGAIIHYKANPKDCAQMDPNGIYLVDSGGHYSGGTTDVTRTVHLGTPSDREKQLYTRVLMGHIDLAMAVFPPDVPAIALDTYARSALWQIGLDYRHGTGHGVGHSIAVHERPPTIGRLGSNSPLVPGMVLSNEPGVYLDGILGIRIENVQYVVK